MSTRASIGVTAAPDARGFGRSKQHNLDNGAASDAPTSDQQQREVGITATQFRRSQIAALVITFAILQLAWIAGLLYVAAQMVSTIAGVVL